MARASSYLNFPRSTEAAFPFCQFVFGTQFSAPVADLNTEASKTGSFRSSKPRQPMTLPLSLPGTSKTGPG